MGKGVRPKTCISPCTSENREGKRDGAGDGVGRRNSDPRAFRFTNPTLSSLNKIKPIAIIKAFDEITDLKSLLDKAKVLEKLRMTQIRSPLLDLRRQELEELINSKSFEVISNELSIVTNDAQSFVIELSARYGDASYRLDLANSRDTLDEATRVKAVENFAATADERCRIVSDLESKLRQWKEVISSSKKVLKAASSDPPVSQINQVIEKAELVTEMHQKSCFLWLSKITNVNVQVMCRYIDQLSFGTISNVCFCRHHFYSLVAKYDMNEFIVPTDEFKEMACILARESAARMKCLFPDVGSGKLSPTKKVTFARVPSRMPLFQEDMLEDIEPGMSLMSFENLLDLLMMENQRVLLRLIYARYTPDEAKPKKKSTGRKTWHFGGSCATEKSLSIQDQYRESDETFWSFFWDHFKDQLVHVFMDYEIASWTPILDQVRNVCVTINDLSITALTSLSRAYSQLFRIYSEHTWSIQHRCMIHAMEEMDLTNPATLLTDDKLSTRIGSFALFAVDPIIVLIRNCESDNYDDQSLHCLTLSVNTLINWITCENMDNWPLVPAVTLIWGDLQSLSNVLKSLDEDGGVIHFSQDVTEVQESNMKYILGLVSQNSRTLVKRSMPRSEYRSRVCKTSSSWLLECFDEAVSQIMQTLDRLSMRGESQIDFVSAFLDGCLEEFARDAVKFSQSGARAFAHDAETLLNRIRQVTHIDETDLLQYQQINNLMNFCRFITSGSPSMVASLRMRGKIAPAGLIRFHRKPHYFLNCFDCCYL